MTGFTSVTFRQLAVDDIIRLAVQAGLDGIEWGGDIHVPPGELQHAIDVGIATRANGLQVFSYGSYYRLGAAEDAAGAFLPILQTAAALCTGQIRIWAGSLPPDQADEEVYRRAAQELCTICELAGKEGISIGLEYHRNTLLPLLVGATQHRHLPPGRGGAGGRQRKASPNGSMMHVTPAPAYPL